VQDKGKEILLPLKTKLFLLVIVVLLSTGLSLLVYSYESKGVIGTSTTPNPTPRLYLPFVVKNYPAPPSTPTSTPTITPTPTGPAPSFGVQTLGEITDPTVRQRAVEAGIHWVRISITWASIEGTQGTYDWAATDSALSSAVNAGLIPLVEVRQPPQWAVEDMPIDSSTGRHYDCGPIDQEDLTAWSAFIQALVERYDGDGVNDAPGSPVVKYWEIWNEPDNTSLDRPGEPQGCVFVGGCWGANLDGDGTPDYQEYAEVLRRAYLAAKAANPEAVVVFGSIAYERSYSTQCFNLDWANNILSYLRNTYGSDANFPFFDLMGFHFYANPSLSGNWSPANIIGKAKGTGVGTYLGGRPGVQTLLRNNGIDKPLICTEYGRASGGGDMREPPETNQGQSRYVVRGTTQAMTMWPSEMKAAFWFTLVDEAYRLPKALGLLKTDLTPKSSWYTYQTTTGELSGGRYVRTLQDTGIEGYVFTMPSGREKTVLWATGSSVNKAFSVASGQQLRVVRMYEVSPGSDEWRWTTDLIQDGGAGDLDGTVNGLVRIQVDANPQLVEQTP
jgi:hypothetical protein